jgi:hypothetical protein
MRLDEATERIDNVLNQLVPTATATNAEIKRAEARPVLVR